MRNDVFGRIAVGMLVGGAALTSSLFAMGDATPGEKAAAQALFDDAKKLAAAGDYASACPKLEESQRLDPAVGTEFKLADCYEHIGKTATAWTLFLEVEAASRGSKDREKVAHDRAVAAEKRLTKLTVTVESPAAGIEVKRDGSPVGKALWGTAVPVDPGLHRIAASAPGMKSWESAIDVRGEGKTIAVTIPPLVKVGAPDLSGAAVTPVEDKKAPPPPTQETPSKPPANETQAPPPDTGGMSGQRTAGIVVGAAGVVAVGVGAVFGLKAISNNNEALKPENCATKTLCTQHGLDLTSSARTAGTISTIAFVAGGVAIAGGVILFATGGKSGKATAITAVPTVGTKQAGLSVLGSF